MAQQTIPVNDGYISSHVGTTPTTGPFAVDFPFFSLNDVVVSRQADGSVIPVPLIRGADYDITGVATDDGSFSSGSITLYIAVSNTTVVRFRTTPVERLSNFPLQGFFSRLALNAELNRITVWMQELHGLLGSTSEASQQHAPIVSPFFVGDPRGPTPAPGDNDSSLATTAFVQSALAGAGAAFSPGMIIDYAGSTAPAGWLLCTGQLVNRTTYAALFAVIGTTYNIGGEAGTDFRVPDLAGRVTAGKEVTAARLTTTASGINGAVLGSAGGVQTYGLTATEAASHSHGMTDHTHAAPTGAGAYLVPTVGPAYGVTGAGGLYIGYIAATGAMTAALSTGTSGSGALHQNTQPTIIMNKIIKT